MRIKLEGTPIPYARPRVTKFATYDPRAKEKKQIKARLLEKNLPIFICPLKINLLFSLYIPKSSSQKKQKEMRENRILPSKRPDLDNLVKFILDCANGILFKDDSSIISLTATKRYSDSPSTIIHLETCQWLLS